MSEILWPDNPARQGPPSLPPTEVETGDRRDTGCVLAARPSPGLDEFSEFLTESGYRVLYFGEDPRLARHRVKEASQLREVRLYADGSAWSEIGLAKGEDLAAAASRHLGFPNCAGAWLAQSMLDVCLAPQAASIMPLAPEAALGVDLVAGECSIGLLAPRAFDRRFGQAEALLRSWTTEPAQLISASSVPLAAELSLVHQKRPFRLITWGCKGFAAAQSEFEGTVLLMSVILLPGETLPPELAERAEWAIPFEGKAD